MVMTIRVRRSPNLLNLDAMENRKPMILSISRWCQRRPPNGGTLETVVPNWMVYTVIVSIDLAHPPNRLT